MQSLLQQLTADQLLQRRLHCTLSTSIIAARTTLCPSKNVTTWSRNNSGHTRIDFFNDFWHKCYWESRYLSIAYFLSNTCAWNYQNWFTTVRLIMRQSNDIFWVHSVESHWGHNNHFSTKNRQTTKQSKAPGTASNFPMPKWNMHSVISASIFPQCFYWFVQLFKFSVIFTFIFQSTDCIHSWKGKFLPSVTVTYDLHTSCR